MHPAQLAILSAAAAAATQTVDYIVVGAGTSGLVIANRLTEDPSVTVAVVEPGDDQRDNPLVNRADGFGDGYGSALDWNYTTTTQPHAGDLPLNLTSGRAWGGTSTLNGMTYLRGGKQEIDAWERLGNPGWNWDALFPYYVKSENYTAATASQVAAGATYDPRYRGLEGPVRVGYPADLVNSSTTEAILRGWDEVGLPLSEEQNSGHVRGVSLAPQTLEAAAGTGEDGEAYDLRWDATRAYLHPVEDRENLVFVKGTVRRLVWGDENGEDKNERRRTGSDVEEEGEEGLVAKGVEVLGSDGETRILEAANEVVLSAGSFRSPGILEASGVGNPSILDPLDIETKVALPGVGENLVDQTNNLVAYTAADLDAVASLFLTYATIHDLASFFSDQEAEAKTKANDDASSSDSLAEQVRSSIPTWASAAVNASGGPEFLNATAVETLLHVQADLLFDRDAAVSETLTAVTADGLSATVFWPVFPFSRGSVHLRSGDARDADDPVIDPRYWMVDFDVRTATAAGRKARAFWASDAVAPRVEGQAQPDEEALPADASDEEWASYLRGSLSSNAHPYGSASMMARELGGVVDPEFRVYGTANVRVVDASIVPIQCSGHPTSTLYALAERAADIIRGRELLI